MTELERVAIALVKRDNLIASLIQAMEAAIAWSKAGKVIGEYALEEMEVVVAKAKKEAK